MQWGEGAMRRACDKWRPCWPHAHATCKTPSPFANHAELPRYNLIVRANMDVQQHEGRIAGDEEGSGGGTDSRKNVHLISTSEQTSSASNAHNCFYGRSKPSENALLALVEGWVVRGGRASSSAPAGQRCQLHKPITAEPAHMQS